MGTFSIWHWLIVLAIALVVFGTNRLRTLGADLGAAVKGFREAVRENERADNTDKEDTLSHSTESHSIASETVSQTKPKI